MLEIKFVRENLSTVQQSLGARGVAVEMAAFEQLDAKRRKVLLEIENLRHRRNVVSEQIADMKRRKEETDAFVADMRDVSGRLWLICVTYPVVSKNLTVLCLKLKAI
jgi:seryl-tRNA synthetase